MNTAPANQRGVAMLLLLVLLALGGLYALVSALAQANLQNERRQFNARVLQQARDALIGYATTYPEIVGKPYVPGHLPCPDLGGGSEGVAAASCAGRGISALGMLPWQTLGLPPLKDYDGNCLWYAVSGTFKAGTKPYLLNWDSLGQFRILASDGVTWQAGATATDQAAAVILAPGPALAGQSRASNGGECGKDYDPSHFLDRINAPPNGMIDNAILNLAVEGSTTLINPGIRPDGNDQLGWLSPADLFGTALAPRGIARRNDFATALDDPAYTPASTTPALAERIAECLAGFAANNTYKRLPWASPLALAVAAPNTYDGDNFKDSNGLRVGRVPFHVWQSYQATGKTSTNVGLMACSGSSSTSCRLLRTDNCPAGWALVAGTPTTTSSPDGWWDKWKDHFFYAVAADFQPAQVTNTNCTAGGCLYVDGVGPYAGVVIYANRALPDQRRVSQTERNTPANYLEGSNVSAIQNNTPLSPGFGAYTQSGNDRLVCIRRDLSIDPRCTTP